jgi:hypothetical protein
MQKSIQKYKHQKYVQKTLAHSKTSAHPKSLVDGKNSVHRKILVSNVGTREKLGACQGWHSRKTRRPPMLVQQKY